jgi:hypothetical protein
LQGGPASPSAPPQPFLGFGCSALLKEADKEERQEDASDDDIPFHCSSILLGFAIESGLSNEGCATRSPIEVSLSRSTNILGGPKIN